MLTLPIKKKWYDMIFSGEKKEEYREIKPYYTTRFQHIFLFQDGKPDENHLEEIRFTNGYGHKVPSFTAFCHLEIHTGHKEWGAEEGKLYYVLHIDSKPLKYHPDIVEKRMISSEEITFLEKLQEELNTQDHIGQADPRYWVIRDFEKIYGNELNNADGIEIYDESGENVFDFDIVNGISGEQNTTKIAQKFISIISEHYTFSNPHIFDEIKDRIIGSFNNDILEILEDIIYKYDLDFFHCSEYQWIPKDSGMFFSHKAAREHLRQNHHHYSEKAITYAQTAWRSSEGPLWKILQETNWEQIRNIVTAKDNT